jgi:ligand-binding sensor domain-containing protein
MALLITLTKGRAPLLVATVLAGCSMQQAAERGIAAPALLPFTYAPMRPGFHHGGVRAIFEDRQGNHWIGTIGGGAWRYDGRELRQFTAKDGLTTPDVMTIARDRDGELWFGGIGVFRFTGTRFERVH